jgi:hypothetical protein
VRDQLRQASEASRSSGGRLRTTTPPTPKQLRYLQALAVRTGTAFAVPESNWHAGEEIERLRQLPRKQ